ncbi:hypothetical protein BJ978_000364 [Agromyces terreus]|uniref:Sucrase ferredoxin n=1 Tax=Agromyces terreus TaxID=424795 RepID=A0A9X2GYI8_9MICO|nr:sucrase ferredoxin [Agromyces terreus]MCP2369688.1 hypothetical protein [Agromyces terreus]
MSAEPWAPCSDRARERGDPLAGTAPPGIRWLLVEAATGWGPNALLDPPFDPALGRQLVRRAEANGFRILAIRRPGRRTAPTSQRWAIVDSRPGLESIVWGEAADASELTRLPLDGSTGTRSTRPVFAVCAHGRHDRCCAVRGRRVAVSLAAVRPEETWECSHVGGDRFAGTMVVFPHGLYYGYADDGDASRIVDAFDAGRVLHDRLRGRSTFSRAVQTAQHHAREAFGDDRIEAYPPLDEQPTDGGVRVRLADADGVPIAVELAEAVSPPLLSTCAATRLVQVGRYELREAPRRRPEEIA